MQSSYKVYYFPGNGRAANLRAILTFAKANWEDVRVKFEDWASMKSSGMFEYGQMPALEIDGKIKTQTLALEVLLSRRFNLMGASEEEEYEILNLLCSREDLTTKLRPIMYSQSEEDKSRRPQLLADLAENFMPQLLKAYEAKFNTKGGQYFLGDTFTLADIFIASSFLGLFRFGGLKDALGELPKVHAPKLDALVDKLLNNELADYFNNVFIKDSQF